MPSVVRPHVLIVGAGIGGLALAQGLKKFKIPFTIVERDRSKYYRPQGYRIRINNDGHDALKANLSPQLFDLFKSTCATTVLGRGSNAINPLTGGKDVSVRPPPSPPSGLNADKIHTADRITMREVLMQGLEDSMKFGSEFVSYKLIERDEGNGEGVEATFTNGDSIKADLLVAADGVRSSVRRQFLPNHKILDTLGRAIYGKTLLTPTVMKGLPPSILDSMAIIQSKDPLITLLVEAVRFPNDNRALLGQQFPHISDYLYWVMVGRDTSFGVADKDLLTITHQKAMDLSLSSTKDWHPSIQSLFLQQEVNDAALIRISTAHYRIPSWTPSNVTLIGDAIHTMSPTGGVGANTALRDAKLLCQTIVEKGVHPVEIGRYEEEMRRYAGEAISNSRMGGVKFYNQPDFDECKTLTL